MSSQAQPHNAYKYTPSSAHATRAVLSSSEPASASNSSRSDPDPDPDATTPFRPSVFRRKSTNYADAAAAAAAEQDAAARQAQGSGDGGGAAAVQGRGGEGREEKPWKPQFGRKQSWDRQDLKRSLMMSGVGAAGSGGAEVQGFTEAGK